MTKKIMSFGTLDDIYEWAKAKRLKRLIIKQHQEQAKHHTNKNACEQADTVAEFDAIATTRSAIVAKAIATRAAKQARSAKRKRVKTKPAPTKPIIAKVVKPKPKKLKIVKPKPVPELAQPTPADYVTFEQFERLAFLVYGDWFSYDPNTYKGFNEPMVFDCREHGTFTTTPNKHVNGYGCQQC